MPVIRLTREFSFDMAHALEGYDGLCRHIHGHSYRLFVTVAGTPCQDQDSPKYGMVMDFTDLKAIVNRLIIDRFDHALMIRDTEQDRQLFEKMQAKWEKVYRTDYQPTCENLILKFAEWIAPELPAGVELVELKLYETSKSHATWRKSDNP